MNCNVVHWDVAAYVLDMVMVEGYLQDYYTGEFYTAPCLIPRTCRKLTKVSLVSLTLLSLTADHRKVMCMNPPFVTICD
jgi:hypothetical protein